MKVGRYVVIKKIPDRGGYRILSEWDIKGFIVRAAREKFLSARSQICKKVGAYLSLLFLTNKITKPKVT